MTPSIRLASCHRGLVLAAVLLSTAGPGWGEEIAEEPGVADEDPALASPLQRFTAVDPLAAPRFTRTDAVVSAPLPVSLAAPAGARFDLTGFSRRWWLSGERADVGVGLGAIGYRSTGIDGRALDEGQSLRHAVPSVSLAMRYRVSPGAAVYADASNARGLYGRGSDAYFTKLGVEWSGSPQSGWSLARGGIGLQLDSGKTMTMRIKGGGLGIYLRSKF